MSDSHEHEHTHAHERAAPPPVPFRFEAFADALAAQAAFEAAYPLGSPIEPALQALVNMGAQCKSAGPARVACRYVEKEGALISFCWHVALDADRDRVVQRVAIDLSIIAV